MPRTRVRNSALPTTPEALAEFLDDAANRRRLMTDADEFAEIVVNYAESLNANDPGIEQQVREQAQRVLAQMLRDNGAVDHQLDLRANGRPSRSRGRGLYNNARAVGAAANGLFEDTGDFLHAIWHGNQQRDGEKLLRLSNALSGTVPSEGGFLVPESFRSELLVASLESAIVRPRAFQLPMPSAKLAIPAIDSTTNVGSVFGGIVAYWTEEGAAIPDSEPRFGRAVLDAKKLAILSEVPNELVADGGAAFNVFVETLLPMACAHFEDLGFLTGSGVGEPKGVLNSNAMIEIAKETSQPADTIVWENVVKAFARMLPSSLSRAVWIASPSTIPQLLLMVVKIRNVAGTENVGGGPALITFGNGADAPPTSILGRPLIFSEKLPPVGDAGDLVFVDLMHYLIGDRQIMTARSSEHQKFNQDITLFRVIERVDGRPWVQSPITPAGGGDTLSPFVRIAVRA